MDAQVLRTPPISGQYTEVRFNAVGDCTWVRFDVDSPWVGVFGPGHIASSGLASLEGAATAFVISSGQGYLVSKATRELLYATDYDFLKSVIAVPGSPMYVACDETELFAYDASGLTWRSARVSVDGIRLNGASRSEVQGEVYDLSRWIPFSLAIPGWEYSCDWRCPYS